METVKIELSDADFLKLAKMAHEQNITFNHLVERILSTNIFKFSHNAIKSEWNDLGFNASSEEFILKDTKVEKKEEATGICPFCLRPKNHGKPWNDRDVVLLVSGFNRKDKLSVLANTLERTPGSVQSRLKNMGLLWWCEEDFKYYIKGTKQVYPK